MKNSDTKMERSIRISIRAIEELIDWYNNLTLNEVDLIENNGYNTFPHELMFSLNEENDLNYITIKQRNEFKEFFKAFYNWYNSLSNNVKNHLNYIHKPVPIEKVKEAEYAINNPKNFQRKNKVVYKKE